MELPEAEAGALRQRFHAVRSHTVRLAEPLSEEDCCAQSMTDASPVKWHLAHTTWFFETFLLEKLEPDFKPYHPAFRMLFNSYYNGIGAKHPRPQRGMLTRPALREVQEYRRDVDHRIDRLLRRGLPPDQLAVVTLGLHHEQQHQELILTDVKNLLSLNPLKPAYSPLTLEPGAADAALEWLDCAGGVVEIGHAGDGFCFDNEVPRHRRFVEPFRIASRLVNNTEYQAFVEAGGYRDPALWLSDGWDWVQAQQIAHPLYWQRTAGGWQQFTLSGMQPLDPRAPAIHLCLYEADAYARWAGARLPTEAEWECAADGQWFGACWQWTSSSYAPYPGFAPAAGAIGEYNGKFMVNQYVLRGSSCATPEGHARLTYRNFFPAAARWQYSGVRLAKS